MEGKKRAGRPRMMLLTLDRTKPAAHPATQLIQISCSFFSLNLTQEVTPYQEDKNILLAFEMWIWRRMMPAKPATKLIAVVLRSQQLAWPVSAT